MEKALRNLLRTAVVECRKLLVEDIALQLEGRFGITRKGEVVGTPASGGANTPTAVDPARDRILTAVRHLQDLGLAPPAAVARFVHESAFTALNRLAALKLMEHGTRKIVEESVARGRESKGLALLQKVSPSLCRTARNGDVLDGGYRLYLELLYDDLAGELGVLFDRRLPQSAVFPSDGCLRKVLDRLNAPELAGVWHEDEAIGWVYQYFTPKEQRDQARKAHSAPQNSEELAFRNQFYTPRYVVAFLGDNTLGRIWYQMRQGKTRLAEQTRFLVRYPNEVFLTAGATPAAPPPPGGGDVVAGATPDVLRAPVMIAFRPKKDPRDLWILDPACGSGHFLLYAYELLLTIYEEAWEDPESPPSRATGKTLRQDYPERAALRRALPGLILAYNLHGIDIDRRATQIAAWPCGCGPSARSRNCPSRSPTARASSGRTSSAPSRCPENGTCWTSSRAPSSRGSWPSS